MFDVQVNVSVVVLEPDRVGKFVLSLTLFHEDAYQDVEVFNDEGDLLPDDLCAEILLDFSGVVEFVDVLAKVGLEWVTYRAVLEDFH